jgi:hypothetical protein
MTARLWGEWATSFCGLCEISCISIQIQPAARCYCDIERPAAHALNQNNSGSPQGLGSARLALLRRSPPQIKAAANKRRKLCMPTDFPLPGRAGATLTEVKDWLVA